MPETLYIGSDINTAETKVLFDEQDFLELVEERMGRDARAHIESIEERHKLALEDAYNDGWSDGYEDGLHDQE